MTRLRTKSARGLATRGSIVVFSIAARLHAAPASSGEPDPADAAPSEPAAPPPIGSDGADAIELPRLEHFVEAPFPAAALGDRIEGDVLLLLTISEGGDVTAAEVLEGPGHGLDEAARNASLAFRFRPARRNGQPRGARIRYVYEFRLPPSHVVTEQGAQAPTAPPQSAPNDPAGPARPGPVAEPETAVMVRGERETDRRRRSANAVTIVDLTRAQKESADVAEVLARTEGVYVQRAGGLGSRTRFSLGGFDDNQIRVFVDGVPLEYSGYSFGLQNVPLSFAQRIDVYRGVVPVRLGADSLGGAFDLITDRRTRGTQGALSFQGGSFGTYRLATSARHFDEKTGLFGRTEAFFDTSRNDYEIDVEIPDDLGRNVARRVPRTHDAYRALGANLEVGLVDRDWAKRLLVRVFATDYEKEIPHNVTMTKPYGEATYGGFGAGGNVRYEHDFGRGLSGNFVTGYIFDRVDFLDVAECVYDWFGSCIVDKRVPGEIGARASDSSLWDHTVFARWNLGWNFAENQALRFAIAPSFFTRTGEERRLPSPSTPDPLKALRDMTKWVNGVEHEIELVEGRLQNLLFGKAYLQVTQSEELLANDVEIRRDVQRAFFGAGDGLRFRLGEWSFLKASYEYAIRLPEPVELFGNGVQIVDNLLLEPERSHNANLSFLVDGFETRLGRFDGSITGFYRGAENLIFLLGRDQVFRYENVYRANTFGVEATGTWKAPGERVELGANTSYQDLRNASGEGTFGQFDGQRIPNKPYFTTNAHARLRERGLAAKDDEIALTWYTRYVHEFFRGWENVGDRDEKPRVDAQLFHTIALSYVVTASLPKELSFSVEVQNLTDERTFDFFGVERPGRAFFAKTTALF